MDAAAPAVALLYWPPFLRRFLLGLLPCSFSCALFGALSPLLPTLGRIAASARIGCSVGDQIGSHRARHVGARGVVLTQEAGQRRRRDRLQQAAGALVAGSAGTRKKLGSRFAGIEVFL